MKKRRVAVGIAASASLIIWIIVSNSIASPVDGKFPSRISEEEQRQIASVVNQDRYSRAGTHIWSGDVKAAWRRLITYRKVVLDVGDQNNGDIWVLVRCKGSLVARYIMKQDKGNWKIAGSDI